MNNTVSLNTNLLALTAVRARQFIVGSINSRGEFSIALNPTAHKSLTSALAECDRLSRLNPGKTFIALQFAGGRLMPATPSAIVL